MKFWQEGDRSEGICSHCKARVETIFAPRTVRLEKIKKDVKDVLVAVCAQCDAIVAIPPQSTPRLKEVRRKPEKSLEVRVPFHLKDIVLNISDDLGAKNPKTGMQTFFRYYLRLLSETPERVTKAKHLFEKGSIFSSGTNAGDRISMKLDPSDFAIKKTLLKTFGKDVFLVKAMIALGKDEIFDHPNSKRRKTLRSMITMGD